MSAWLLIPAVYVAGFVVANVLATRHWLREYPQDRDDPVEFAGACFWGALAGILWPAIALYLLAWRFLLRRKAAA